MAEEAAPPPTVAITREALRDGTLQRMVALGGEIGVLSDAELTASRRRLLASHPAGQDLWLFAYGSLIWNPAFLFAERRIGVVHGLHRRFCLWTNLGRGSPDHPGLVLGLDRGGRCRGVIYRIAAAEIEAELDIVWRREMVTGAYRPRWVRVETAAGPLQAVTFAINRAHRRYAGSLTTDQLIATIATARGALGSCADYLFSTTSHLEQLGIADAPLARLATEVRAHQLRADAAVSSPAAPPRSRL